MNIKDYLMKNMINAQDFTNAQLEAILWLLSFHGITNSMYTLESFRHPEFHILTCDEEGKLVKCSLKKPNRKLVTPDELIKDWKLYEKSPKLFTIKKSNTKEVSIYCSLAPNFFIYAFDHSEKVTYSLIANQYWVRSAHQFTEDEILRMGIVHTGTEIYVN